ncbi:potassium channel subfamily K member 18-like [Glandiceps talaboti]
MGFVNDLVPDKDKGIASLRHAACRFNVFRKSIRNTTILFVAAIAYVMLGGKLFQFLEGPDNDISPMTYDANTTRPERNLTEVLWNRSRYMDMEEWILFTMEQLENLRQLDDESKREELARQQSTRWNYFSACFFCLTVVSTIGYGTIAPVTISGRFACILYAVIGIPLFVIFLVKLGRLIAVPLKYIHKRVKQRYVCCQQLITEHTADLTFPGQTDTQENGRSHSDKMVSPGSFGLQTTTRMGTSTSLEEVETFIMDGKVSDTGSPRGSWEIATDKPGKGNAAGLKSPELASSEDFDLGWGNKPGRSVNSGASTLEDVSPLGKDMYDEIKPAYESTPVTFIVIVLLVYIMTGSGILMLLEEKWTFVDCIYFSIITFTTIGFGDITPADRHGKLTYEEILVRQTFVSCYIVVGLVIMSIALNLARDELKSRVRSLVKEEGRKMQRCRKCLPKCVCSQATDV